MQHKGGGGAATHAGTNYQDYVAAWVAVQILAEQDVSPPWDLPEGVSLESLHAEAPNPIDDLAVETSGGGRALVQVKHTVTLATSVTSPLASSVAQFVQEFLQPQAIFDPNADRFVLVTSPQSSGSIKFDLRNFLRRLRTSPQPDREWTVGSREQRDAGRVVREHIKREWTAARGVAPTDQEIHDLARLVHIDVLDVDPGGHDAQYAKDTLRQRVLKDPSTADQAWNTLVTKVAEYAAIHQRAGRPALQRALVNAGLDLYGQRSYRADIERLKTNAAVMIDALQDYSCIRVGAANVVVQREATRNALAAASDGHLLILGDPGAGKSGSLHELAAEAGRGGQDVVLFVVDQIDTASLGTLRNDLGLEHELITILDHWPGTQPGYLIIDALDAARTAGTVQTLHTLMDLTIKRNGRWHVVASVRKFDLRHNPKLQQLFSGAPPTSYTDHEFFTTRHVNMPALSDEELAQVDKQAPVLGAAITLAPALLRELLRAPFNLRLLAELIVAGVSSAVLEPLRTQLDLLDRYWQERIIRNDGDGDGRQIVLKRATRAMVQRRAMRIPRETVVADDTTCGPLLSDLLSTHVLAEWAAPAGQPQYDVLTFPHHVLYDYAIARLAIPVDDDETIAYLTTHPDLLLAIRPSIDFYLQRRWGSDPVGFWPLALHFVDSTMPEVGKLMPASVAALYANNMGQLAPLIACLKDPARHLSGVAILRHVLATLRTRSQTTATRPSSPWISFLDEVRLHFTPELANVVRPHVLFLSERVSQLSTPDQMHLGKIGRRLLAYGNTQNDIWVVLGGIETVIATITTDQNASVSLLRECITPEHLRPLGHKTLTGLTSKLAALANADPVFVRDLYLNAFLYPDVSEDETTIGNSQILPMRSHRKQDYDLGLYQLTQYFHDFLNIAPTQAIRALLPIIDNFIEIEHGTTDEALPVTFDGALSSLLPDYSRIWDHHGGHDHVPQLLDTLQQFLERTTSIEGLTSYLRQIIKHQPPALVWRRLLVSGSRRPDTIGRLLCSLAWDRNILTADDTSKPAGELLRAISPTLTLEERALIENAIMNLPNGEDDDIANDDRDRLLACLDPSQFATQRARERYDAIIQSGSPPSNDERPLISHFGAFRPTPPTPDPIFGPLVTPVASFATQHLNGTPSGEEIAAALPSIRALYDTVATSPATPPADVRKKALTNLAESILAIARNDRLTEEQASILLPIALIAASSDAPPPGKQDDQTKPVSGWSPSPRLTGAAALIALAGHAGGLSDESRVIIGELGVDPVRHIRVQIASRVLSLYNTDQDLMWTLLRGWAAGEQNPTVLADALHALLRLPVNMAERSAPLSVMIFQRAQDEENYAPVREACIHFWVRLALWGSDSTSNAMLDQLFADPVRYEMELKRLVVALEGYIPRTEPGLSFGAFALLHRLLTTVTANMRALEVKNANVNPCPVDDQQAFSALAGIADTIAQRLYFASGAFHNTDNDRALLPVQEFYGHAKPLFELLAPFAHPHTTHHLVETLQHFIEVDAAGVLLILSDAITASSKQGYAYEPLAEGLVVKIVERYLAEFRHLLRDHPECHAGLMRILDAFVRVGWQSAHQLTYQLSDIYR